MQNPNGGMWPLAILMIVIVSWIFYRYAAPKGWKEWSRAGLVQAFIIALYAEMYGFPLTIYLLTGFFGLDIPLRHESGHLWATLLGYGRAGQMVEMLLGYTLLFIGAGMLMKGWREVYVANSQGRLAKDGLYGKVRHPQYVGIIVALFGQIIHWPTVITVALFPIIVFAYLVLAHKEERKMIEAFGDAYREYQRRVPRFIPRIGRRESPHGTKQLQADGDQNEETGLPAETNTNT